MVRFVLVFVAGIAVGAFAVTVLSDNTPTAPRAATPPTIAMSPADSRDEAETLLSEGKSGSDKHSAVGPAVQPDKSPELPMAYRRTIGPIVRHLSFAEEYDMFENEPVDAAWAYGMEAGMTSYLANLGPETGAVFEFVQCRSTSCALAGYVLNGYENQSASMVGQMRKEPWWDGGSASSSLGGSQGGQERFVILLSRYNSWERNR